MIARVFRLGLLCLIAGCAIYAVPAIAATPAAAVVTQGSSEIVRTALLLSLLAVIPALLICTTSFMRIIIVLAMVRHAFGMPQTPPNQVLTSLALFMTAFIMGPTLGEMNDSFLQPVLDGKIEVTDALQTGTGPIKTFMLDHTRESDIATIYTISKTELPATADDVELLKLIPAFMLNELRVAFTIGFVILLPFLLIDLVVSSILLSLGMMMVPPATISLPIKVMMFVLIDGWSLVLEGLLGSFG